MWPHGALLQAGVEPLQPNPHHMPAGYPTGTGAACHAPRKTTIVVFPYQQAWRPLEESWLREGGREQKKKKVYQIDRKKRLAKKKNSLLAKKKKAVTTLTAS